MKKSTYIPTILIQPQPPKSAEGQAMPAKIPVLPTITLALNEQSRPNTPGNPSRAATPLPVVSTRKDPIPYTFARAVFYLSVGSKATTEAANVLMSLSISQTTSFPEAVIAASASLVFSVGLNGKPIKESLDETMDIVRKGSLPASWPDSPRKEELKKEWPLLSKAKERGVLALVAIPLTCTITSKISETYFFVSALPNDEYQFGTNLPAAFWSAMSIIASAGALFASLPENSELYKKTRQKLASSVQDETTYYYKASCAIGAGLGVVHAFDTMVSGHMAMISILNGSDNAQAPIKNYSPLMFSSLGFNFVTGGTHFWTAGFATSKIIDDVSRYIATSYQEYHFEPNKIIAGTLSAAMGFSFALSKKALRDTFYNDTATQCGLEGSLVEPVSKLVSTAMVLQEGMILSASAYKPMLSVVDKTTAKIGQGFTKLTTNVSKFYSSKLAFFKSSNEHKPLLADEHDKSMKNYKTLTQETPVAIVITPSRNSDTP